MMLPIEPRRCRPASPPTEPRRPIEPRDFRRPRRRRRPRRSSRAASSRAEAPSVAQRRRVLAGPPMSVLLRRISIIVVVRRSNEVRKGLASGQARKFKFGGGAVAGHLVRCRSRVWSVQRVLPNKTGPEQSAVGRPAHARTIHTFHTKSRSPEVQFRHSASLSSLSLSATKLHCSLLLQLTPVGYSLLPPPTAGDG